MAHQNSSIIHPKLVRKLLSQRVTSRAIVWVFLGIGLLAGVGYLIFKEPRRSPFFELRNSDQRIADKAIDRIEKEWGPESTAMTLEILPFTLHYGHQERLVELLQRKTGQTFRHNQKMDWYTWLWNEAPPEPNALNRMRHEFYTKNVYPLGSLAGYFANDPKITVRADEICWGGVIRDAVTPIRTPQMVRASAAEYLDESDLVFGISVNGDARAYPRR